MSLNISYFSPISFIYLTAFLRPEIKMECKNTIILQIQQLSTTILHRVNKFFLDLSLRKGKFGMDNISLSFNVTF